MLPLILILPAFLAVAQPGQSYLLPSPESGLLATVRVYGPILQPGGIECKAEGFIPHPTDSTKYYRCLKTVQGVFEVFEFWCRDGRVWDQERQVCRYDLPIPNPLPVPKEVCGREKRAATPDNVECTRDGFLPDPVDPAKFYRCIRTADGHFQMFAFACKGGRKWDQERKTCRYDPPVPRPLPGDHHQGSDNVAANIPMLAAIRLIPTEDEALDASKSDADSDSSSDASSASAEGSIESSEDVQVECLKPGFVPHPTNPEIYYKCLERVQGGFEIFEFWCRAGRKWDQERQVCRYDGRLLHSNQFLFDVLQ